MKLSIITSVLNSHEIVRRQIIHYSKMNLPDTVEIIYVDDGSIPRINFDEAPSNFNFIRTGNYTKWTEHIARNIGARLSTGEYLFLIDADYIVPEETILKAIKFDGDRMGIRREFGILDENGDIKKDYDSLLEFNLKPRWARRKKVRGHRSQFVIRRDLFFELGGYNEKLDGVWRSTGGAGEKFWRIWQRNEKRGRVKMPEGTLKVYMFPNGKYATAETGLFC